MPQLRQYAETRGTKLLNGISGKVQGVQLREPGNLPSFGTVVLQAFDVADFVIRHVEYLQILKRRHTLELRDVVASHQQHTEETVVGEVRHRGNGVCSQHCRSKARPHEAVRVTGNRVRVDNCMLLCTIRCFISVWIETRGQRGSHFRDQKFRLDDWPMS